jgi:hypothetical protein
MRPKLSYANTIRSLAQNRGIWRARIREWMGKRWEQYETAAFYEDPTGIVHLWGEVNGGTPGTVFKLPPGYRLRKKGSRRSW